MDDRVLGGIISIFSLLVVVCYFWLIFLSPWAFFIIQLSAFIAVTIILLIIAWVGYTLATTPSPTPLIDVNARAGLSLN